MGTHDVNVVIRARDEASKVFNHVSGAAHGMSLNFASLAKSAMGLAIGAGGVYAIGRALSGSARAFIEADAAAQGLADALGTKNIEQYKKFAAEMQRVTTFEDDATLSTMKLGVTIAKLSGDDLMAATVAAMGLSKAYKMDLEAAMTLVSKAAVGEMGSLKRLGIVMRDEISNQEKYTALLKSGKESFRMATGETESYSGVLKQMANAWGDCKENVGQYIAESARLKDVFSATAFGLAHIADVAQTAWSIAMAAMMSYYDKQAERANWDNPTSKKIKGAATGIGTAMADWYLANFHGITTEGRQISEVGQKGRWSDIATTYEDALGRPVPVSGAGAMAREVAGGQLANLMKLWDDRAVGKFDFGTGGYSGGETEEKVKALLGRGSHGGITLESRTARFGGGGINPVETLLQKQVQLLEEIKRDGKRQLDIAERGSSNPFAPVLLETDFR